MSRRLITDVERRARLGRRQVIEPAATDSIAAMVDRLVVLHATDPATIYLSVGARWPGATTGAVDAALFEQRSLYRTMAMRRTLFVCSRRVGPDVEGSSAPAVARVERKRLEKFLADTDPAGRHPADPSAWVAMVSERVLAALGTGTRDGPDDDTDGRSARELSAEVPELATKLVAGKGTRQEMEMSATSRVLGLLALEGHLIRGRPASAWTGRQYRWHRRERWWSAGEGPVPSADAEGARARLIARYLGRFGPATVADLVWWTGWTKTSTRAALATIDAVEVDIEGESDAGPVGEPGLVMADDVEAVTAPEPWAALLPALDPTPMGWKQRHWYLGQHQGPLFDRNGNIGPTVWLDGRIVGGWGQRPDGEVVVRLLEDVGADSEALIGAEITRIGDFVGDAVVKPSFPTPLQRELSVG